MKRVEFEAAAERDLVDAYRFYQRRERGLGKYFLHSLKQDTDRLSSLAGIHGVQYGYHRMLARHFPYGIFYRVDSECVRVWAVLDLRRDPDSLAMRLREEDE